MEKLEIVKFLNEKDSLILAYLFGQEYDKL